MALRDWICNSVPVATATVATSATPNTKEARPVAKIARIAVAREAISKKIEKEKVPLQDWPTLTEAPEPCRDCTRLEFIEGVGAGCVKTLPESSPWNEEWRRTPKDLTACKQKQTIVMVTGHDCGKCGANDYQQTADGWRCCSCGMVYPWIDGSAGACVDSLRIIQ
ncbi:MAG: hypothetical protein MUO63_09950 [Desulfobulbaceae bacterium]|nr:hypothetical protein [Desulfobulbaceae bacterium]